MLYSTTINTFRFSLVILGFLTLVACGSVENAALSINEAPTASSVSITYDHTGNAVVGDSLTGNYVYADAENDAEGVSIYRWLRNGTIIGGATTLTYTLAAVDIARSITFEVTPVAVTGTATGSAVSSSGITTNSVPVAHAGADQTSLLSGTIILDGSASSDVDGDMLSYSWSLTTKPTGSQAILTRSTTVNPSLDIDVQGDYVVLLIVNDGTEDSAPDTVTISTINSAPVANAGADQTALFGNTVTLDGSASSDVDGDVLTYSWSYTTKPPDSKAILTGSTTVHPTFKIDVSGDYVVQLIVNDSTVSSEPDTMTISTNNSAPVANAGADQAAFFGDMVILDGSASSDVDGDGLTYSWSFTTKPPGSTAALTDPAAVKPAFGIDVSGDYVLQLIVNDSTVSSEPDTVSISTKNSAPVANAGADEAAFFSETVTLDGSASSDVDGDGLTYSWSFTTKPTGSQAILAGSTTEMPTFKIDVSGEYVVQLIVNDATVDSAPDTAAISTKNTAPVANAGADQAQIVGSLVILDGSASGDVDGDGLTYRWSFVSVPTGSTAFLFDPTTVQPFFDIDVSGDYVVQLIVNDNTVDSAPDTVTISTTNSAPVANAGVDQTLSAGDTVTLDGSASSDIDNDRLTYRWSFLLVPQGSRAALSDSAVVNPNFDIDVSGHYLVQLIVNDGMVDSLADTVTISAP